MLVENGLGFWQGGNELLVIQGIIRLLNRNYLDPDKDW